MLRQLNNLEQLLKYCEFKTHRAFTILIIFLITLRLRSANHQTMVHLNATWAALKKNIHCYRTFLAEEELMFTTVHLALVVIVLGSIRVLVLVLEYLCPVLVSSLRPSILDFFALRKKVR